MHLFDGCQSPLGHLLLVSEESRHPNMQIKGPMGLSSRFPSGKKLTERVDSTPQLPKGTLKAGTAKMYSYKARREMHWCGAPDI